MIHQHCDHASTKTARQACRNRAMKLTSKAVGLRVLGFVKMARAEGFDNKVHLITFDEVAQSMNLKPGSWNLEIALRACVEEAVAMNLFDDCIDKDQILVRAPFQARLLTPPTSAPSIRA